MKKITNLKQNTHAKQDARKKVLSKRELNFSLIRMKEKLLKWY